MLIQLVLDPIVASIEPSAPEDDRAVLCVTVTTETAVLRLVAVHDDEERIPDSVGGGFLRVPRSVVLRQPRMGNARMVWAARGRPIPAAERLRIMMHLEGLSGGLPVRDLVAAERGAPADRTEAVFALACEGLLTVDLSTPFSPSTCIRCAAFRDERLEVSRLPWVLQ